MQYKAIKNTLPNLQPRNIIYEDIISKNSSSIQEISQLIKRSLIQSFRRPSSILSGIIQPLLWLILFGNLFQNIPINLFITEEKYGQFLSHGIIIFAAFTGSLNAGLPLMFDREFGFLNRLLSAPLISKDSLILSSAISIICITMLQTFIITIFSIYIFNYTMYIQQLCFFLTITLLITSSVSNFSIGLAFILPGHIEFLAFILIINLPTLFSSTALAPLSFMPYWLQIIANLNPLTYAIESIRLISTKNLWISLSNTINTLWIKITILEAIIYLMIINLISFISMKKIISKKLE